MQYKVRFTKQDVIEASAKLDILREHETLTYFIGDLAYERLSWKDRCLEVNALANKVMAMYEAGLVEVSQKRIGAHHYEYTVRRRKYIDPQRLAEINKKVVQLRDLSLYEEK